jgi:hypothetical protein
MAETLNVRPTNLLATTVKLFEEKFLIIVQRRIQERNLINASRRGVRSGHVRSRRDILLHDAHGPRDLLFQQYCIGLWYSGIAWELLDRNGTLTFVSLIETAP